MTEPLNDRAQNDTVRAVLLVAYDGSPMSEAQLHLACRAAKYTDAAVRVLHVITLPRHIPLEDDLPPAERERVNAILDRAERIALKYGVPCESELDLGRSVGEAIIADAAECSPRVIYIGLRDRRRPGTAMLLSKTLRHVLQHAQCPVQIGYLPAGLPERLILPEDTAAGD